MPHNDRNEGFRRYELERGGRMRSAMDRDRYRTGYEQPYSPSWDERPGRGDYRTDYGADYRSGEYWQPGEPRERWERRYADQDAEREAYYARRDYGERGLFGTGESRTWDDIEREETYGPSSGDYEMYGRSSYGAQSGYGRDYGRSFSTQRGYGQDFRERLAEERYGREPEYGYAFGQSEPGQFRGRGPKGYERSDERLREIICERLTDEPSIDASDISIDVKDKVVKLTGYVSDRRTKYEIEDLVERAGGVKDIDNQIRVRSGWGMTQSSGSHIPTLEQSVAEGTISGADTRTGSRSGSSTQRRT